MNNGKAEGPPPEYWHFDVRVGDGGAIIECDKRSGPEDGREPGPIVWKATVDWSGCEDETQRAHAIIHLAAILRDAAEVTTATMTLEAMRLGLKAGQ